jgi:hypothetical protein
MYPSDRRRCCGGFSTWRGPRPQNFLDLVSNTNTHAARTHARSSRGVNPGRLLVLLPGQVVPTAQGARAWSQATVRALLMREGGTK